MLIRDDTTSSGTTSSMNNLGVNNNNTPTKKKYRKKPDPSAPKITRPCSECGKKFWSWKALFGHMRCHPERQWRGINPPPNFNNRHNDKASSSAVTSTNFLKLTDDDHEAALSLLMLANQSSPISTSKTFVSVREGVVMKGCMGGGDVEVVQGSGGGGGSKFRFGCSSCKKVFGSPQALGGHRASHKNVKGCFANSSNSDGALLEEELSSRNLQNCDGGIVVEDDNDKMLMLRLGSVSGLNSSIQVTQHHQCNICFRDFPTGQALGGHKRCHWEKLDNNEINNDNGSLGNNWNLLAPTPPTPRIFEGGSSHGLHSTSLEGLDLRLGL